jgi:Cd2+/Zn2+-exporting ATPase
VVDVVPAPDAGVTPDELLALAAAVERYSEHPLARAIVRAAEEGSQTRHPPSSEGFESLRGQGVQARVDGGVMQVGKLALFGQAGGLDRRVHELQGEGKTVVAVGPPDRPLGLLALADRPREGASEALAALRRAGVRHLVMLTGDNEETARAIGRQLGIDDVRAGLMPEAKVRMVEALERELGRVAMVGDGVNDGPALATASVGVAMGAAASDTALETADVALMGDDLGKLAYLYRLSHQGRRVIRQNIAASIALKGALALGVPLGWVSLIVAVVVGDMGASLGVTSNSLRLARLRP